MEQSLEISEWLRDVGKIGKCHQFLAWIERDLGNGNMAAIGHYRAALRCFEQVQAPEAEKVRADLRRLGEEV